MKKLVLVLFVGLLTLGTFAQNIQTHYDMGKDRGYLTTTIEMFKPDKTGNTFFFIDFDYGVNWPGVNLAYFEIARCFKLGKSPFSWHFEYNGGLLQDKDKNAHTINNAWLTGLDYSWNAKDFSRGFSLKALYKNIEGKSDVRAGSSSYQFTAVWYLDFAKGKLRFNGFADLWREPQSYFVNANGGKTTFIFLSEPQLWYNFNKNFALGSEVEIASNFGLYKGLKACPTLALKYTF